MTVYTVSTVFIITAVDCGPLTVTNGQISTSSGTTFMNTATYTCDDGYTLNGVSDRTCQADRTWSLTAPIPVIVSTLNKRTYTHVFTYVCFISC